MSRELNALIPHVVGYDDPKLVTEAISKAKVIVGIPSKDSAHTIAYVINNVAKGLIKYFEGVDSVIIISDGLSRDGTQEVVKVVRKYVKVPTYILPNVRAPGKGSAVRLVLELASNYSDADATVLLDSDLRSITPEWVAQLVNGAMDYGFVAPRYVRDRYDATITNFIARPLTTAAYGVDITQPIGGDFGLCKSLVKELANSPLWTSNPWVNLFGVDIFITHTALARGFKVCEADLKAKIHEAKDPSKALKNMFVEVVGSLITMLVEYSSSWLGREFSEVITPPLIKDPEVPPMRPWRIKVDVSRIASTFKEGLSKYGNLYREVLGSELHKQVSERCINEGLGKVTWFEVIIKYVEAFLRKQNTSYRLELLNSLMYLWMGRLLKYVNEVKDLDDEAVQQILRDEVDTFVEGREELRKVISKYT